MSFIHFIGLGLGLLNLLTETFISNLKPVITAKTADPILEPEGDTGRGLDAVHGTEGRCTGPALLEETLPPGNFSQDFFAYQLIK